MISNFIRVRKTIILAIFGYVLLLAFLFFFQRNLQYSPMGRAEKPAADFVEKKIITADGIKLLAWFKEPPLKPLGNQKIVLYFHGNAGNLGGREYKFAALAKEGFGVLAISYRGYFGSEGKPSEAGLIKDGEAAFKFLLDQGYLPKDVILFGESLGSGVAVQLASKFDFFAVILESPFSSITSVAKTKYWFAPINLLLKDKFDSIQFAPKISSPVLIFHGTDDEIVNISEGKKLFEAIKAPKKFIEVQGAGHLQFPEEFLVKELSAFAALRGDSSKLPITP